MFMTPQDSIRVEIKEHVATLAIDRPHVLNAFDLPPLLGQHTDDMLANWLGWDAKKIERFNATRVSDG